jgi:adenylate cyclase
MALELANAHDGVVLQSLRVPSQVAALFDHPSEPVHGAVAALQRSIIDREARAAASRPLPSLASYTLLAGSIGLMHRTEPKDFDRAPAALSALIERVPRHGSAYAWMAKWHLLRMIRGKAAAPSRDRSDARQFIDRSLERDEHQATAWALKGLVNAFDGHDLRQAEECYQTALLENPNEALAWLYMGTLRSWQGRGAEAGEAARRALSLTPLDPMRYYFESLAAAAVLAEGSHEAAIELARSSLRVNARHTPTYRVLTIASALAGQEQQAREAMGAMRALEPDLTAREYLDRYPGRDAPHARLYVDALRAAGLPD